MGGDTLWSLAQDVAPSADPRDVVDAIARLNALDGVTITPGQRLAIPAEYTDARLTAEAHAHAIAARRDAAAAEPTATARALAWSGECQPR